METRYLKTLVVAAETGSFSRTAEILHLTQSAVSQRMKFLEENYGHQLLDRSGPVLVPTEVGKMVLKKARQVLEKEQELLEGLKRFEGDKRLSLCSTPTFGTAFLPEILNEFMLQNQDLVDLRCVFRQPDQAVKGLEDGSFDLAVLEHCSGIDLKAFRSYELPRDELVFISAPKLNLPPSPVPLEALLGQRIYVRRNGCSSRQLLVRNLAEQQRSLEDFQGQAVSDDLRLTVQSVLAGCGISFMSRSLVAELLERGELRASTVVGFLHQRCRSAAVAAGRTDDKVVQRFLDCLFQAFAHRGLPSPNRSAVVSGVPAESPAQ